jgi:hypothetical protein
MLQLSQQASRAGYRARQRIVEQVPIKQYVKRNITVHNRQRGLASHTNKLMQSPSQSCWVSSQSVNYHPDLYHTVNSR